MKIIVIGGGAAGFFGAIRIKELLPKADVLILEKTNKLLSKVRVSGGGRCNVTHACFQPNELAANYPRGEKPLKQLFRRFQAQDTVEWFEKRGVMLKSESDGRMFPITDNSETIIQCFMKEAERLGIQIKTSVEVQAIVPDQDQYTIHLADHSVISADKILIATGGHPKSEAYQWLRALGLQIVDPVPSLFTFNVPNSPLQDLMGVAVPMAQVKILSTKWLYKGPLLVTHWGFSGPAVLKLSAWGARFLAEQQYQFSIHINWNAHLTEDQARNDLELYKQEHPKRLVLNYPLWEIPQRLWQRLVERAEIQADQRWLDLPKKQQNKLMELCIRFESKVSGKTTFKEEFVTCGGISWQEINTETMESKKHKGIFFAGEVLDADGITGGFNFQNAWTTAFVAAEGIVEGSAQ